MESPSFASQKNMKNLMQEPSYKLTTNPLLKSVNFYSKETPVFVSTDYSILSKPTSSVSPPELKGKPLVSLIVKNQTWTMNYYKNFFRYSIQGKNKCKDSLKLNFLVFQRTTLIKFQRGIFLWIGCTVYTLCTVILEFNV